MPAFEHTSLSIHYEVVGTGQPFIFQHGLGGDTAQPLGLLRPPPGTRLIAFDCRGHGQTPLDDPTCLSFETLTADWLAMMDHLGLERVVTGGISLGAALALRVALRHPERVSALVLVRPAWLDGALPEANRRLYALIAHLIREHGVQRARELFTASPALSAVRQESPAAAEAFLRQFDGAQVEAAVERLERLPAAVPHPRHEWRALRLPALVLACRGDSLHPFVLAQSLAAGLPGAGFAEVTSRHDDPNGHAADVQRAVEAFLSRRHLSE